MNTVEAYRRLIYQTLSDYASIPYSHGQINSIVIESLDRNHFTIVKEGWNSQQHIHHCLVHVQIKNDKIWIHFDGTEDSITETLVAAGVPKDKIVLAFHPPHVRKHTEYAIA
ncbi:MAG: XisI protein [Hormoscilla sp. GUM202]|nr:XisI protein [Hormoscilla sp. GM7CHS1pb]MBO1346022.1 XisI protein [Hormoscilla sp. GUM202]